MHTCAPGSAGTMGSACHGPHSSGQVLGRHSKWEIEAPYLLTVSEASAFPTLKPENEDSCSAHTICENKPVGKLCATDCLGGCL